MGGIACLAPGLRVQFIMVGKVNTQEYQPSKLVTFYMKPDSECDECQCSPCFPVLFPLLYSLGSQPVFGVSIPSSVKFLWACQNRGFFDNVKST